VHRTDGASPSYWRSSARALLYGGTLDVDKRSTLPPALGGRGNMVGSYKDTASVVVSVYGNWSF
jgi:hypothetical protein